MAYTVAKIPVIEEQLDCYSIYIYITCRIRLFLVYVMVKIASPMVTFFFRGSSLSKYLWKYKPHFSFTMVPCRFSPLGIPGTGRKSADCYRPSWEP